MRSAIGIVLCSGEFVIDIVRTNNGNNSGGKQVQFPLMPKLFCQQKANAHRENQRGEEAMVTIAVSMQQSKNAYHKSQGNHAVFESKVMNDVDAKQGEAT